MLHTKLEKINTFQCFSLNKSFLNYTQKNKIESKIGDREDKYLNKFSDT